MSTCSGEQCEHAETGSMTSCISRKTDSPFISLILIIDDEPKASTACLEDSITNELKWRGVKVGGRFTVENSDDEAIYQDKVKQFLENIAIHEQEAPPCVTVVLIRTDPSNADNFKSVIRDLNERESVGKFSVCLIFTVGVLVINDEVKTEDLDFSNNGLWLAKYLARELIVQYTRHLGINNNPHLQHMKTPPIAIFVRETPVVGQKPLSTSLAEALSMEPISFVHHRVGYLISQPDTIAHLCDTARENGFARDDITNGCKIYLKNVFNFELDSSAADVVIIDTLNDIYVDIEGMMNIAQEKAYSTFVMEDATEDTIHRIVDTMVWMIKRRCNYTDGPFADYFYTQISLHKEMETLRMFYDESLDCSSEADLGKEDNSCNATATISEEDNVGNKLDSTVRVTTTQETVQGSVHEHGDSTVEKKGVQTTDKNDFPEASTKNE